MRPLFTGLLVCIFSLPSFSQTVGYGFVNRKGNEILTVNPDGGLLKAEDALRFSRAICDGGRLFDISYSEKQSSGPRDTMRAVAANFDQHEGFVFRIEHGRAEPDGNCLLAPPSFFEQKEPQPLTAAGGKISAPPPCDDATLKSLPVLDERKPLTCAVLARSENGLQLLAIEYQQVRRSLLGALAIKSGDKVSLHQFPADAGDSSWRVDDKGKWDPASFQPLFLLHRSNGEYDLGIVWSGPEGATLHLLRSEGSQMSDRSVGYRYWLPK